MHLQIAGLFCILRGLQQLPLLGNELYWKIILCNILNNNYILIYTLFVGSNL